jgi:hypothetical protein
MAWAKVRAPGSSGSLAIPNDINPPPKSARNVRGNIWSNNLQIWRNSAKPPQQNDTLKLRSWRASLFRKGGTRFLGHVNAPDREAAKIAAVERFKLDDEQRRRLVLQERA